MSLTPKLNFKTRSSADEIGELVEEAYLKQRRADGETTKETFAPSSIGGYNGTCPRFWYMAFDGANFEYTHDASSLAIMGSGTAAHERIEGVFEDTGILVDKEIEIVLDDPPIRGYLDMIVNWKGENIVGEIKTTRQEAFTHKVVTRKPSPQHLLQLLIYMRATGCQKGFVFYENRNTLEFVIIPVAMTPENEALLEDCLDWLRTVRQAWENQTIPKAPYQRRNKICKACPLYQRCADQPVGALKIPAFGRHND